MSPEFLENLHLALQLVDMPRTEADGLGHFFAGDPLEATACAGGGMVQGREEEEEGGEGEEGSQGPPNPKRRKQRKEKKAEAVASLQVWCVLVNVLLKCLVCVLIQKHRKLFGDAWLSFLRLPVSKWIPLPSNPPSPLPRLPPDTLKPLSLSFSLSLSSTPQLTSSLYKKVLTSLHTRVMPHLLNPRLLIDFLVDSYDTGTHMYKFHCMFVDACVCKCTM